MSHLQYKFIWNQSVARKCLVVLSPSWLLNMIMILLNVLLFGKEIYLHVLFLLFFQEETCQRGCSRYQKLHSEAGGGLGEEVDRVFNKHTSGFFSK